MRDIIEKSKGLDGYGYNQDYFDEYFVSTSDQDEYIYEEEFMKKLKNSGQFVPETLSNFTDPLLRYHHGDAGGTSGGSHRVDANMVVLGSFVALVVVMVAVVLVIFRRQNKAMMTRRFVHTNRCSHFHHCGDTEENYDRGLLPEAENKETSCTFHF